VADRIRLQNMFQSRGFSRLGLVRAVKGAAFLEELLRIEQAAFNGKLNSDSDVIPEPGLPEDSQQLCELHRELHVEPVRPGLDRSRIGNRATKRNKM